MDEVNISSLPKVAVLLATHHPNEFIKEQIDSIKQQKDVQVKIYWGDFASSEPEKAYVRTLLSDTNSSEFTIMEPGPAANFFYLLSKTSEDYIAFADQDDMWLPTKLSSQLNALKNDYYLPSLNHSNSDLLVGTNRKTRKILCRTHDFSSLAFTNCCQGCTMMINGPAREIILKSLPEKIIWHDWWIALVLSLVGKISFSEETFVLYRIHSNNAIGIPSILKRVNNLRRRPEGLLSYQIEEAIKLYATSSDSNIKDLLRIQRVTDPDRCVRFRVLVSDKRRRISLTDDVLRRIAWVLRQP